MLVIAPIASMKFLPFMKIAELRPATQVIRRSHMRNRAGRSRCDAVRPYFCGEKTISDFSGDRARLRGQ
jgi:hypothetical protein